MNLVCSYLLATLVSSTASEVQKLYNLPEEHMGAFFRNNPEAAHSCMEEPGCPYKHFINATSCWGYEPDCSAQNRYNVVSCPEDSAGWAPNKQQQQHFFFNQGDFGFIRERNKTLSVLCRPHELGASLLECVSHMELCRAKNIRLDFKRLLNMTGLVKYREDILGPGLVGGYCRLDKDSLRLQGDRKSPLQSWFAELEHFEEMPFEGCDVVLDRPTVLMKLDATVNMYHHFCDFLNLYVSMHFNNTLAGDFDILIWDTVPGCRSSGLFKAFNRHVLHKLNVKVLSPKHDVRVTLLSRTTRHRRILNEDELLAAARKLPGLSVRRVHFSHATEFRHQIEVMANTDVLIGMHGAGLTHVLFQPDWAVLFEIYNCDDPVCYKDLARLRGVKYFTWEDNTKLQAEDEGHHPTLGAHAKFTNYRFDVDEFLRILRMTIDYVKKLQAVSIELGTSGSQFVTGHQEL
ncbi:EGF domain-specific O-linked N-acetylglucosamine transferase isoform X7 [Rhipicephalus microplus]|uniref:EGF domain-specific O-linked N-acetylglucosamine transferase isoform X7 n=1 Tax=Rhipicephalus microplus TaxID=6941 RepID=UPI003F6A85F8